MLLAGCIKINLAVKQRVAAMFFIKGIKTTENEIYIDLIFFSGHSWITDFCDFCASVQFFLCDEAMQS